MIKGRLAHVEIIRPEERLAPGLYGGTGYQRPRNTPATPAELLASLDQAAAGIMIWKLRRDGKSRRINRNLQIAAGVTLKATIIGSVGVGAGAWFFISVDVSYAREKLRQAVGA